MTDSEIDRRRFMTSLAVVGVVPIAGCSGDESDSPEPAEDSDSSETEPEASSDEPAANDSTEEDSPDETDTEQTEPEEPEFEFVGWDVPSEIEINQSIDIGIAVENTGDAAGDFTAPLYERTPDSDWTSVSEVNFGTISPGSEAEATLEGVEYQYINRYELRLSDFEEIATIQTISAQLDWGSEYITQDNYVIHVEVPELEQAYEYEDVTGATSQREPDNGGRWVFVDITVRNETGQASFSPARSDFVLLHGNSQAEPELLLDDPVNKGQRFESGDLQPGVERSGWIAYQIPSGVLTDDVTFVWSPTTFDGDISVNWT
jgi:hypothetical protein